MYKIAILYFIGELKVPENNLDPQQNALFREIDEELRNDKMKAFWEKYRFLIAAVIVCAILGAVAFETFKYWREQLKERDAAAYTDALTLALEGKSNLEIADILGISLNSVKSLKKEMYSKLRKIIGHEYIVLFFVKFLPHPDQEISFS